MNSTPILEGKHAVLFGAAEHWMRNVALCALINVSEPGLCS